MDPARDTSACSGDTAKVGGVSTVLRLDQSRMSDRKKVKTLVAMTASISSGLGLDFVGALVDVTCALDSK